MITLQDGRRKVRLYSIGEIEAEYKENASASYKEAFLDDPETGPIEQQYFLEKGGHYCRKSQAFSFGKVIYG